MRLLLLHFILVAPIVWVGISAEKFSGSLKGKDLTDKLWSALEHSKYLHDEPTEVSVTLRLRSIVRVYRKIRGIKADIWMSLSWSIPSFAWDPAEYDNITKLAFAPEDIWNPDLVIANSVDYSVKPRLLNPLINVNHKAEISFAFPLLQEISCQINVFHYPFDEQECDINITTNTQHTDTLSLVANVLDVASYSANSEWALVDTQIFRSIQTSRVLCTDCQFQQLTFRLILRRRPTMPFFYFYVPNILINIQTFVQFLLPLDSLERMKCASTLYLAITFYLLIISDVFSQSLRVPVWVIYISLTALLAGVAQMLTIYTLYFHFHGNHDNFRVLPSWARDLVLHKMAGLLGLKRLIYPDEKRDEAIKGQTSTVSLVPDSDDENAEQGLSDFLGNFHYSSVATADKGTENPQQDYTFMKTRQLHMYFTNPAQEKRFGANRRASQDMSSLKSGSQPSQRSLQKRTSSQATVASKGQNRRNSASHIEAENEIYRMTPPNMQDDLRPPPMKSKQDRRRRQRGGQRENVEGYDSMLFRILKHGERVEERAIDEQRIEVLRDEWKQVAMVVDRLLFIIYTALTVAAWIYVFVQVPAYDKGRLNL